MSLDESAKGESDSVVRKMRMVMLRGELRSLEYEVGEGRVMWRWVRGIG